MNNEAAVERNRQKSTSAPPALRSVHEKTEVLFDCVALQRSLTLTTISNLPIKEILTEGQQPFIEKVDQILTLEQTNA